MIIIKRNTNVIYKDSVITNSWKFNYPHNFSKTRWSKTDNTLSSDAKVWFLILYDHPSWYVYSDKHSGPSRTIPLTHQDRYFCVRDFSCARFVGVTKIDKLRTKKEILEYLNRLILTWWLLTSVFDGKKNEFYIRRTWRLYFSS